MKTRLITSILFLLFIVSCGSSDTDSIDTINTQKLDKTISTMAIGDNLYSFEYDDNNRVTTCKAKEVWQENWDAYFTYSNDKVVFKLNQQTISYSINNGLIVSEKESGENREIGVFIYSNGYLSEYKIAADDIIYEWNNGNLVKRRYIVSRIQESISTIEYTSYKWPENYFTYFTYSFFLPNNWILWSTQLFGKKPKNLPSKISHGTTSTYIFNYEMEEGYPTKIHVTFIDHNTNTTYEHDITLTWN